jgi:hypothetical protein
MSWPIHVKLISNGAGHHWCKNRQEKDGSGGEKKKKRREPEICLVASS